MRRLEDLLAELKREYLECLPQRVDLIRELAKKEDWFSLEVEFHKLKGTGKTYGVPEVSILSALLENHSASAQTKSLEACEIYCQLLSQVIAQTQQGLPLELDSQPDYVRLQKLLS